MAVMREGELEPIWVEGPRVRQALQELATYRTVAAQLRHRVNRKRPCFLDAANLQASEYTQRIRFFSRLAPKRLN
jgi:hypothetical protein